MAESTLEQRAVPEVSAICGEIVIGALFSNAAATDAGADVLRKLAASSIAFQAIP